MSQARRIEALHEGDKVTADSQKFSMVPGDGMLRFGASVIARFS